MTQQVLLLSQLEPLTGILAYLGMLCILCAFAAETRGKLNSRGKSYLWLMAGGSILLGIRAGHTGEWAFVILEIAWAVAAFAAMFKPPKPLSLADDE